MVKELKSSEPIQLENKFIEVGSTLANIASPFTPDVSNHSSRTAVTSAFLEGVSDLACGSLAGMIGKVIEHPFDTVKVRLQTQTQFAGPLNCLSATLRHEGIPGLFRGLPAPMLGSMMENATLFFTYRHCQNLIRLVSGTSGSNEHAETQAPLSIPQLATAGGLAGAVVSFVLTPFELIKCRAQVANLTLSHSATNPMGSTVSGGSLFSTPSTFSIFTHTLRSEGIGAFYRGHTGTFLRESGGGAAYFGIYEFLCRGFCKRREIQFAQHNNGLSTNTPVSKDDLVAWELMTAGAFAGIGFNLSLFPADAIKSRVQTSPVKIGFLEMGKHMYQAAGLKGFYRGCGVTLVRSIPSNACILYTYEALTRWSKKTLFGQP